MEIIDIIGEVFRIAIFPLLAILTTYLIQIIRIKTMEIAEKTDNDLLKKYLNLLSETIINCVIATNQTYVDSLKAKGEFTIEAQKEAFNRVFTQVKNNLEKEAYNYLQSIYVDLDSYIATLIEATVKEYKN